MSAKDLKAIVLGAVVAAICGQIRAVAIVAIIVGGIVAARYLNKKSYWHSALVGGLTGALAAVLITIMSMLLKAAKDGVPLFGATDALLGSLTGGLTVGMAVILGFIVGVPGGLIGAAISDDKS
jgi:hypothetical protein